MKRMMPVLIHYQGHWIVNDCLGNAVGFDSQREQAVNFLVNEMKLYIEYRFIKVGFIRAVEDAKMFWEIRQSQPEGWLA